MNIRTVTAQRLKNLVSPVMTFTVIWLLVALFAIAFVSSDEAQRVFAMFLVLAGLGFATRTRKYTEGD